MIPLSDTSRRHLRFPVATVSIIGLNVIVFFLEMTGGDAFVTRWALVPADRQYLLAVQNYMRSIELNPGNENGAEEAGRFED